MFESQDGSSKTSFGNLISVTFANRSKMIEIVYNEKIERNSEEEN